MQKLKILKLGVDEAALAHNWGGLYKAGVKKLLNLDFMSSKDSDDGSNDTICRSVIMQRREKKPATYRLPKFPRNCNLSVYYDTIVC